MSVSVVIPVHTTRHPMLLDAVQNVRDTIGLEPVVWETPANVAVARNEAMAAITTDWICFLDSDAFPQEAAWLDTLIQLGESSGTVIVAPHEVLDFGTSRTAFLSHLTAPVVIDSPTNCAGMCLLVRRDFCAGLFDEHIGLTQGFLGPCIEDTDFAHAVAAKGGALAYHPDVHVLHKDRGTVNLDSWLCTDEALAYRLMSALITAKWHPTTPASTRPSFFREIRAVESRDQRTLARHLTHHDLLDCYLPVVESSVPAAYRAGLKTQLEIILHAHCNPSKLFYTRFQET